MSFSRDVSFVVVVVVVFLGEGGGWSTMLKNGSIHSVLLDT